MGLLLNKDVPIMMVRDKNGEFQSVPAFIGRSTYQAVVDAGFDGTEDEFYEQLAFGGGGGGGTVDITFSYPIPLINEKGTTLPSFTVNWEYNGRIKSQSINGTEIDKDLRTYTITGPISSNISIPFKYMVGSTEYTKSIQIRFYYGIFYGVSSSTTYNESLINSLTKQLKPSNSINFTVVANEGEYIYFACPVLYGEPTFEIDGFTISFLTAANVIYRNASGESTYYNIYRSTYSGIGRNNVIVK